MELYPYQRQGVDYLKRERRCILADEMGLGKTAQAISACKELGLETVLVIAPATALDNWKQEVRIWWPEAHVVVVRGKKEKRNRLWDETDGENTVADVYIVNYESYWVDAYDLTSQWGAVVVDEAHVFRNRKVRLLKALKKQTAGSDYLFLLTGTPLVTEASDPWSYLHLIDPKTFSSYWRFLDDWFLISDDGHGRVPVGQKDPDGLAALLADYTLRRTKDAVLNLPKKVSYLRTVELHPPHRVDYDAMEESWWIRLEAGGVKAATNTVSCITYLRQLALDPLLVDPETEGMLTGAKAAEAWHLLAEYPGEPVVVFSQYTKALGRFYLTLAKLTPERPCLLLTGDTPHKDRPAIIEEFNKSENAVLLCSRVGGIAVTFTGSRCAIFLDRHWTAAANVQAEDRLHRVGQDREVHIYTIEARDTMDQVVAEYAAGRAKTAQQLLGERMEHEE